MQTNNLREEHYETILKSNKIPKLNTQTLVERITELERFVDTIYKKNRDLEIDILNLKRFTGIESTND